MKKVVFIYAGSSEKGGLDTYYRLLFENCNKLEFDFRFVSLGRWATSEAIKDNGGKVYEIENHRFSPISLIKLIRYVRKEKIDLVVTAGLLSNAYGRKVAIFTGVPVLTAIHSNYKFDYPGILKRAFYYISDKTLRHKTTHYITVSEYLRNNLIKSGIKKEKISVVYNGIKFKNVEKKKNNKVIVIGSIGRLHKTKGFDVLIKSMSKLPENVLLKIWGEGSERKNLENIIKENNLSKRVFLEGFSEDIHKSLSEVDIYVQPSRMEGFGFSVVEAMGAGLPVIVSNNGALPELIKNKKTGIIIGLIEDEVANTIATLINDEKLRETIGESAERDVKKRFSIKNWISNLESVIEKVTQ